MIDSVVNGHEATLLSRFLNDEMAIERYPDLKAEHFASPVHRQIFKAILTLHYDGYKTIFPVVEDYLRARGKLPEIGEHTISDLAGNSRIAAMDESVFAHAVGCVHDSYAEREANRIGRDLAADKITADFAREKLEQIRKPLSIKVTWLENIDRSTVRSSELATMQLSSRKPLLGAWLCEGDYGLILCAARSGQDLARIVNRKSGVHSRKRWRMGSARVRQDLIHRWGDACGSNARPGPRSGER